MTPDATSSPASSPLTERKQTGSGLPLGATPIPRDHAHPLDKNPAAPARWLWALGGLVLLAAMIAAVLL